jgi:predicted nucleic acid-binding protein
LGLLANPKATPQTEQARIWLHTQMNGGACIVIPDIVDYEVRRELIRGGKTRSLQRLNALHANLCSIAIDSAQLREAGELWAQSRNLGRPTASPDALDGDMILIAQARAAALQFADLNRVAPRITIIATANVAHLALFADAREWQTIT